MGTKRRRKSNWALKVALLFFVVVIVLLAWQFFTKTGLFHQPGVVYYDESLTEEEVAELSNIFTEEVELENDLTITARTLTDISELEENDRVYSVDVPVTDFYDYRNDTTEFAETEEIKQVPFVELNNQMKLLSLEGYYYLDEFDVGAYFRVLNFDSKSYEEEIQPLIDGALKLELPTSDNTLTMAQTGVTAMSRGMNEKLGKVGEANYFAENIKDYLSGFDITHTSNEASFSKSANADNICSDERFKTVLQAIGLDVVELTGNHNQDCGNQAALDTIQYYDDVGIKRVGGGRNAEEAAIPLELSDKGTNITFLAYNLSTGGATTGNAPGANQYEEEKVRTDIAKAKEAGNYVIVDMQYYECSAYASEYEDNTCDYANSAAGDQVGMFRHLIDLGADLVVGTSAHQPQTFEIYGNGVIYYGLGNLFFDQVWWPGTTRSLILAHYFYNGKLLQTRVVPTIYDKNMQTKLMEQTEAAAFIKRLAEERP